MCQVALDAGHVRVRVDPAAKVAMTIHTPNARVHVVGTVLEVGVEDTGTSVAVLHGVVDVEAGGSRVRVAGGQMTRVVGKGAAVSPAAATRASLERMRRFERDALARRARHDGAPAAPPTAPPSGQGRSHDTGHGSTPARGAAGAGPTPTPRTDEVRTVPSDAVTATTPPPAPAAGGSVASPAPAAGGSVASAASTSAASTSTSGASTTPASAGSSASGAPAAPTSAAAAEAAAPVADLRRMLRQGRSAQARAQAEARSQRPEYARRRAELFTIIAESHAVEGSYRRAVDAYRQVWTESPGTTTAANARLAAAGISLDRLHDPTRAIELYEDYLQRYPHAALRETALVGRCRGLAAAGRRDRAASCARAYLTTFPHGRLRDQAERLLP